MHTIMLGQYLHGIPKAGFMWQAFLYSRPHLTVLRAVPPSVPTPCVPSSGGLHMSFKA